MHRCVKDVLDRQKRLDDFVKSGTIDLPTAINSYAWVVGKDTLGLGHIGAADPGEANDKDHSIPFTVSVYSEDRDGDVVVPMGCQLENYRRNPVVFFGHQENPIPVAKSVSPDGRLCVWPEEDCIRAVAFFDEHDSDAMFLYGKVKRGFLNAASIAFVPIEAYRREEVEKARVHNQGASPSGWLFKRVDLTEWSLVGVPSNAGAIRDVLDHEKSFISPRLQKALKPYAAKSKGCWGGWCPCPTVQTSVVKDRVKHLPTSPQETRPASSPSEKGYTDGKLDDAIHYVRSVAGRVRRNYSADAIKREMSKYERPNDENYWDFARRFMSEADIVRVWADAIKHKSLPTSPQEKHSIPSPQEKSVSNEEIAWRTEVQRLLERELGRGALELVPSDVLSSWYKERRSAEAAARLAEVDFHGGTGRRTGKLEKSVKKYITHTGSQWVVHSESGKVLGKHESKEDAERQLRAVEANKHKSTGGVDKKAPLAANVRDYVVGDRVVARSYIAWKNPDSGKTEGFAKSGERLEVVGVRGSGTISVRNGRGDVSEVGSSQVRRVKSMNAPTTSPQEKAYDFPSKGDVYDNFGETWVVERIDKKRNEVQMRCDDDKDAFGKVIPKRKVFHVSALRVMRKKSLSTFPQKVHEVPSPSEEKPCGCRDCQDHKPCPCVKAQNQADVPAGGGPVPINERPAYRFERWKPVRDNNGWWCEDSLHPGSGAGPFDTRLECQRRCEELNRKQKSVSKGFNQGDQVRITEGEYGGETGVVYGNPLPQHGAVGTPRGRFGELVYRVQVDGFPKPGGWDGKVTVRESWLQKKGISKGLRLDPSLPQSRSMSRRQVIDSAGRNDSTIRQEFSDFSPALLSRLQGDLRQGRYPWELDYLETKDRQQKLCRILEKALGESSGTTGGYVVPPTEEEEEGDISMKTRCRVSPKSLLRAVEKLKKAGVACKGSMTHTRNGVNAYILAGCDVNRVKGLLGKLVLKVEDYGDEEENEDQDTGEVGKSEEAVEEAGEAEEAADLAASEADEAEEAAEEDEGKEVFEPLPSAKTIAAAHGHAKSESDWLNDELGRMDNPAVKEAMQSYHDEMVSPRMEHLEGLLGEHHPDHDLEGCMKALEQDVGADAGDMETGEAGKIDSGEVPPDVPVEGSDEEGVGDKDSEEILERYQTRSGKWVTRVVGHIRKGANGKRYLVKGPVKLTAGEAVSLVKKMNSELGVSCAPVYTSTGGGCYHLKGLPSGKAGEAVVWLKGNSFISQAYESGGEVYFKSLKRVSKGVGDLEDDEHTREDGSEYSKAVGDAGQLMGDMVEDDEVPKRYKGALRHHSKQLGYVSKALTDMGKVQRDGGSGSPLTDEGTMGNRGRMSDRGGVERNGSSKGKDGEVSKEFADRWNHFEDSLRLMGIG